MDPSPSTATFLFTDLENSTPLWEKHPDLMQELSVLHDALIQDAIVANKGKVVKPTGDGFHAVFDVATDGLAAALAGQLAIIEQSWPAETGPLLVRMGLHTGESQMRGGDYYGSEVNRAARVMGLAYGGQVLVSEATAALIRKSLPPQLSLTDLGKHRLRGFAVEERIFQIYHPSLPSEFPHLRSLSVVKNNLPVQLSSFVGREKELADVKRLLNDTHLLTLLGPGGTGKTRLMLEAAEDVIGRFDHGVWLVELAPLTDPHMITERAAAVLTVQEQPGRALLDTIVDYLRHKELLLLLDNVEHLVREGAVFAQHLLSHCPRLKILVTGREALFIPGETTLQIPSLSLPDVNGQPDLEVIQASEGVQLFLARAQDIRHDFELSPENAAAIAEIVQRLDGIPLALEMAAARLRMLTAEQIAERLNDRFRLLTGGHRTALPRQQTLQALIDWSWNLLDEKERLLIQRLSVFSGGWSLDAAQKVVRDNLLDEYDVFDLLEQLVNKSLVTVEYPATGEVRYNMLESIHQYSRERLFESGEGQLLRDRHADYYVAFAEEAAPHLNNSTMLPWIARITAELDNLRAVLAWTLEDRPELTLRIGANLLYAEASWLTPKEAQFWLEPAVEKSRGLLGTEGSEVRMADFVKALIGLALAHAWQGNNAIARQLLKECIQLARDNGEYQALAYATFSQYAPGFFNITAEGMQELEKLIEICREKGFELELVNTLGAYAWGLHAQGKTELAMPYFQELLEIVRRINNPRLNAGINRIQGYLAEIRGDLGEAKDYILLAIENYQKLNDRRGIVFNQSDIAHILRREGKLEEAEAFYRRSIIGWQEIGQRAAVAHQLECFAFLAIGRGEYEHAAKLLGAAGSFRRKAKALSEDPREIKELVRAMEQLSEALGEEQRDEVLAQGSQMSLDEAVQFALKE